MINPLNVIQNAMIKRLTDDLKVRAIFAPGGKEQDSEQYQETVFAVGWDTMSQFELVQIDPRVIQSKDIRFNVTLDVKNASLRDKAMDFIIFCVVALDGLQPIEKINPLLPVQAGFQGHDYKTGYSRYQASFTTSIYWETNKFNFDYAPVLPSSYELILELWNAAPNQLIEKIL